MDEPTQTHPETRSNLFETPTNRNMHWIFFGKDGLRVGWSALLFLAISIVLIELGGYILLASLRSSINPNTPIGPGIALVAEIAQFIPVLAATAIMAAIEKRKISVYGYAGAYKLRRFLWGLAWGFAAISILIASLWKLHLLAFDGSVLHGAVAWKYAAAWGLVFLLTGLFEESLLRGYLQYTLTRGMGFWWSALLLSTLFGVIHKTNPGESPLGLFSAGAVGLFFCLSLWYTGSLWWAIGFHAAWDWGQTYFYGTSDSGLVAEGHFLSQHPTGSLLWTGGATGPEGSLLIFPVLLIMALAMWLWWGCRNKRSGTDL